MSELPEEYRLERARLLAKIEEQAQALQRARALERSNEDLEQFAYVASHDLQEPLRKILGFGERLREECSASLSEEGRDYLRRMVGAAHRMRSLIHDLLAYSRVTTWPQTLFPVSLGTIARQVLSDLEVRIDQLKAQVEIGELPTIQADPIEMRQLLQNLIGNALKFHSKEVAPRVRVYGRTFLPEGQASELHELIVEDNGIGFDEKHLPRMFTIFHRLHGRNEYDGTGIGLAICKKIVSRHGGSITARSSPGQGARFIITLPAHGAHFRPSESVS